MNTRHIYFMAEEEFHKGELVREVEPEVIKKCNVDEAPNFMVMEDVVAGDMVKCWFLYCDDRLMQTMRIGGILYPYGTHRMAIEKYEKRQRVIEEIYYIGELKNA